MFSKFLSKLFKFKQYSDSKNVVGCPSWNEDEDEDDGKDWIYMPGIPLWLSVIFCIVLFAVLLALIFK